ncbi:MAG: amidohydrolase family protein [Acidimicrobiia bacterium]|nr:MAG: amidohydrolase family protein [Acidimicrobiia bacterium]
MYILSTNTWRDVTIRIKADLVIPGRGNPIEHGTVILTGDTIAYAGRTSDAPQTPDVDTVRVLVVMPGLWECHAHFVGLDVADIESQITEPVARRAARAVGDLKRTLMGGVTSAREMGGHGLEIQPAIASGQVIGPTVYGAGRILSTTGGHADIHALPLDALHRIDHLGLLCDGVPEVMKAVRLNLRSNAKVIKICASGGVMSEMDHPIHQQFSETELVAIVEEAARAERIVGAHCHGLPGIMAALKAGVKTIEHGSYMNDEAADLMVGNDAIFVPTRFVIETLLHQEDRLPRYAYEKGLLVSEHHDNAMKSAIARGVKFAMGTDIFVSGDLYGQNSLEIKLLQDAGMTAIEAIEAATANGPDTLGAQAPQSGQLKVGYDADVIAVDFNPLEDNSGWGDPDRVTHVWKSGQLEKEPG